MFDFAWSEIGVIAAVALILIGPKDLPVAIRAVTDVIKKARRMASEFQTHVDEMVREANLDDVRNSFNEIRNFDIRSTVEKTVDPDGSLRSTFASNPLEPEAPAAAAQAEVAVLESPVEAPVTDGVPEPLPEAEPAPGPPQPEAPAFVPPAFLPPAFNRATEEEAPAFIPPEVVLQRPSRPAA